MVSSSSPSAVAQAEWLEAVEAYSARLVLKPHDRLTLCNRSFVLLRLNRCEEALKDAEACIASHEGFAKGYLRRGQALEKLGRRREALGAVAESLKLDGEDESAVNLLIKVDDHLQAGLCVLQRLLKDADDRRCAVRKMVSQSAIFEEKWAPLDNESRLTIVRRALAKGLEEIKDIFIDQFKPIAAPWISKEDAVDVNLLQREILAAAVVVTADVSSAAGDDEETKGEAPTMLRYIHAAADATENSPSFCGQGIHLLMDSYSFPPFKRHPKADNLSTDLIKAQRSTLFLIVAHLLLGGDGLPSIKDNNKKPKKHSSSPQKNNQENDYASDNFETDDDDDDDPASWNKQGQIFSSSSEAKMADKDDTPPSSLQDDEGSFFFTKQQEEE